MIKKSSKEEGIALSSLIIMVIAIVVIVAIIATVVIMMQKNKGKGPSNQFQGNNTTNVENNTMNIVSNQEINNQEINNQEDTGYIGKYVDYTPDEGTYYTKSQYTGASLDRDFSTRNVGWRIWSMDEQTLVLISDVAVSGDKLLFLKGSQGYNNMVKVLNDLCETCYSNKTLGGKARSLNIEDIENVISKTSPKKPTDYRPYVYSKDSIKEVIPYTTKRQYMGKDVIHYPAIWKLEENSNIDGKIGTQLKRSEQQEFCIEQAEQASSYIEPIENAWTYEIKDNSEIQFTNSKYRDLITGDGKTGAYWLASRMSQINSNNFAEFGAFLADSSKISTYSLFRSNGDENLGYVYEREVRPVVEIDLTKVEIDTNTTGESEATAYHIKLK